jgi:hypothetical protein
MFERRICETKPVDLIFQQFPDKSELARNRISGSSYDLQFPLLVGDFDPYRIIATLEKQIH